MALPGIEAGCGGGRQWTGPIPQHRRARRADLRRAALALAAVLGWSLSPVPLRAEPETLAEPPSVAGEAAPAYAVRIEGVENSDIRSLLERSSQLIALRDRSPLTQAALVRRIEGDYERFRTVLRSEGYYDSTIDYRIDAQAEPQKITVIVDPGPAYQLQSYDVVFVGEAPGTDLAPPPLHALGLTLGERARSADVLNAERKLLGALADEARPLARVDHREAVVDHRDRSMRVTVRLDPGPAARFGTLTLEGLETVKEGYVRSLVPWQYGDAYDQRKVDAFRNKLAKAGVFTSVIIDRPEQLDPDGTLPMTVRVVEGKQRSIGAGAKYYTSEGPAGEVFWEHRNLLGRNEDLRITLEVGTIRQKATVSFLRPDYKRPEQDLLAEVQATRQTTKAFDELGVATSVKIRRPLTETWTGTAGVSLEWSQLDDDTDGTKSSTLFGLPLSLFRDATDNKLNPTKGMRLSLDGTPYVGWYDKPVQFLVGSITGTGYQPLDDDRRFVAAGRARIGSILGEARKDLPPNKRFYAGGGDSIRGYQFQKVGPLDDNNDPRGGRSLLELSAELRTQVWGNFGVVPFVDAGNVYTSLLPDLSEDVRWAAGIGFRYLTVVGPIRFDVAFPLNPRKDVDDTFQFYIGLGQAF